MSTINETINASVAKTIGISPELQIRIISSILIIGILWLIRFVILKILWKQTEDPKKRYFWKKTSSYTYLTLCFLLVGRTWFSGIGALTTYFGLLSAGIAIALKDPLSNIAGWLFIIIRRPFEIGDRIQIGNYSGDVIDIRIFQFTLLEIGNWVNADQSTGRILHVPNSMVFTNAQANYSKGFHYIWDEIPILLTFESNWQKAKEIFLEIIKKHSESLSAPAEKKVKEASKKYMIYYSNLTPTVYTSVEASGVLITLRYLSEPRKRRTIQHLIWEDVLIALDKNQEIEFAYPTQRFYTKRDSSTPEKSENI